MTTRAGWLNRPLVRLLAWALYDLANTFFAVAILSFYFPLWLIEDRGAKELVFSAAMSASMILVAVLMPICGAISDATNQRMRYLLWTTGICIAATFALGLVHSVAPAIALFIVGNVCYQLGTVFYDALLSHVSQADDVGGASGFGAAFGYLGSMAGLVFLWPFVKSGGHQATFIPAALYFLLFALPIFLVIREPQGKGTAVTGAAVRNAFARLKHTLSHNNAAPLKRFLVASFFSSSAINTVLVFMVIYTKKALHFRDDEVTRFFLLGQAFSIVGSIAFGRIVRWFGAKRTLAAIWWGWVASLAALAATTDPRAVWVIGPAVGFCLGSTWATSRVLILELSPPDQLAEWLGLAGLLGRFSSVLGPLLWGVIVLDPSRYRQAVLALIALLLIGLWCFRSVPDPARASPSGSSA